MVESRKRAKIHKKYPSYEPHHRTRKIAQDQETKISPDVQNPEAKGRRRKGGISEKETKVVRQRTTKKIEREAIIKCDLLLTVKGKEKKNRGRGGVTFSKVENTYYITVKYEEARFRSYHPFLFSISFFFFRHN